MKNVGRRHVISDRVDTDGTLTALCFGAAVYHALDRPTSPAEGCLLVRRPVPGTSRIQKVWSSLWRRRRRSPPAVRAEDRQRGWETVRKKLVQLDRLAMRIRPIATDVAWYCVICACVSLSGVVLRRWSHSTLR